MREEPASERNVVQVKLAEVERAIEGGGWARQFTAVWLIRMTPVVPFSASNVRTERTHPTSLVTFRAVDAHDSPVTALDTPHHPQYLLGFTPLELAPYVGATIVGILPWAVLYSSVGAASRHLLQDGASIDVIVSDMTARAGVVSENAVAFGAAALGAGAVFLGARALRGRTGGETSAPSEPVSEPTAREGGAGGGSRENRAEESGSEPEDGAGGRFTYDSGLVQDIDGGTRRPNPAIEAGPAQKRLLL